MLATQRKSFNACSFLGGGGGILHTDTREPRCFGVLFSVWCPPTLDKSGTKEAYGWSEVAFVQAEHTIIAAIVTVSYFCKLKGYVITNFL